MNIPDIAARNTALDIHRSFIVQAPAGSGKTSLLTQRYLALLAIVNNPEEIIAITFTKKAAAEMAQRIVEALELGQSPEPEQAYLKQTYLLAKKALKQDALKKWQLLHNKHRLRILTIDAFCLFLTNRMPLLAKAIPFSKVNDNSEQLYRNAALQCLETASSRAPYQQALKTIQGHLGNNPEQLCQLLMLMLQKREQWLKYIISSKHADREDFEATLASIQHALCQQIIDKLDNALLDDLEQILHYQASHLAESIVNQVDELDWQDFNCWQAIAKLCLSSKLEPKSRFTKKEGFPSDSAFKNPQEKIIAKEIKAKLAHFNQQLREDPKLLDLLKEALLLPSCAYSDEQWLILQALLSLLPLLVAELAIIYNEQAQVDFTEISLQALQALGGQLPSELALYLDYTIGHLLIDEFQDTSKKQYQLLECLTEGWQYDDGRTLFVVGDPMQSIYRFREADVGLFLKMQHQGLPQVTLTPLYLECNFRSSFSIVDFVNQCCKHIFPHQENMELGAVCYSASKTLDQNQAPAIIGAAYQDKQQQAQGIVDYIKNNPQENIAILVRSRSQLKEIIHLIEKQSIAIEGVDLKNITDNYIINLLMAIIKMILSPQDLNAFADILVSPLSGLTYQETEQWFSSAKLSKRCDFMALRDALTILNQNARQRALKILDILTEQMALQGRQTLYIACQKVWRDLNGSLLENESNQADINQFWQILEKYQTLPVDGAALESELGKFYSSQASQSNIKIMTIHKSKGLEFDTVILPGLEYSSKDANTNLLTWLETGDGHLLLSPIHSAFDNQDKLTRYIKHIDKLKQGYESQRLFYVAITRAKTKLILSHCHPIEKSPPAGSFLSFLNSHVDFKTADESERGSKQKKDNNEQSNQSAAVRLTQSLFEAKPAAKSEHNELPKIIIQDPKQIIGTFIHEQLYFYAEQKAPLKLCQQTYAKSRLSALGLAEQDFPQAWQTYHQCIDNINRCKTGQWILENHTEARNEYALVSNGKTFIVDRTFKEDNTRWIIDYKITTQIEEGLTGYQSQLNQYAALFHALGDTNIKLMLYYPLLSKAKQWQYTENADKMSVHN